MHLVCRPLVGDWVGRPWAWGWTDGYTAGVRRPGPVPTCATVQKLAKSLGVSVAAFEDDEGEKPAKKKPKK